MPETASDPGGAPDPLEQLAAMVSGTAQQLHDAQAPPAVLAALQPVPELIRRVAVGLRARAAAGDPVPPERQAAWRHDLRERVTLALGWAEIYRQARAEAKRARAGDQLDRSAAALRAFLLTPP
jgi:hypothetical protein